MSKMAEVFSVNISKEKGTIKQPVDSIDLDLDGIVSDAHAGPWHRQVSLLSQESIQHFSEEIGRKIEPGEFAENITMQGIDLSQASLLDRFRIGPVELQLTQIGKKCHGDACAIFREVGKCVMPKEGIFCRVLQGGSIRAGDKIKYQPKIWKFRVITLSDRAHRGDYSDRSGPLAKDQLDGFAAAKHWRSATETVVLPDDASHLQTALETARDEAVDIVVTTGGTGVGPRDITPETVTKFCDKIIPGIMDAIRIKFGQDKPNALLSRSVAGVTGTMLVYAIPGSVKAVKEYMSEITKTIEHLIQMLHGLDVH
ncbi:MAG: MOSC domain-containing protein [Deltaproteobacteria bacterium]|nr:MOSC domain-containing protein [Deltaproteobacteria bacterium]